MEFGRAHILKPIKAPKSPFPPEKVSYDVKCMHLNAQMCNDLPAGIRCSN